MVLATIQGATRRLFNSISAFDTLPDTALIDIKTVTALASRSKSSIYRDIAAGRLSQPVRIGPNSVRWRASVVREYLSGKTK
jgi:predicted DNA-binding transcriptional regulator AlpA